MAETRQLWGELDDALKALHDSLHRLLSSGVTRAPITSVSSQTSPTSNLVKGRSVSSKVVDVSAASISSQTGPTIPVKTLVPSKAKGFGGVYQSRQTLASQPPGLLPVGKLSVHQPLTLTADELLQNSKAHHIKVTVNLSPLGVTGESDQTGDGREGRSAVLGGSNFGLSSSRRVRDNLVRKALLRGAQPQTPPFV